MKHINRLSLYMDCFSAGFPFMNIYALAEVYDTVNDSTWGNGATSSPMSAFLDQEFKEVMYLDLPDEEST